jgi:hypothetical protein
MKAERFTRVVLSMTAGVTLLLGGCSVAQQLPAAPPAVPEAPSAPPEAPSSSTGTPEEEGEPESSTPVSEEPEPMPPEQVVEHFYNWYLDYARTAANPVSDGAYKSSEYLAEAFIKEVDRTRASLIEAAYDPFLGAQVAPEAFAIQETTVSGEADKLHPEANATVRETWHPGTSYELTQVLAVTLQQVDGWWKITSVTVVTTPGEVVAGFYRWYTNYPGNPLADGTYRSSENLTQGFIDKVDGMVAFFEHSGTDPFLCTQDVPREFTYEEAAVSGEEASQVVHTDLAGHTFTVQLRRDYGRWKIGDVVCPQAGSGAGESPASWQVFADEAYGFQVRFPESWSQAERPPVPAGFEAPEGINVLKRLVVLEPMGWRGAEPPLQIVVTEGTAEEFGRIYGTATGLEQSALTESLEINGQAVVKAIDDLGETQLIRYTFQSPTDTDVRIVVIDAVSGDPDQAEANKQVMGIVQQIISTFAFIQ